MENKGVRPDPTQTGRGAPSVISSAAAMSMGTLASRVLGYVRDLVLYGLFPHTIRDAFIVAMQLPNIFRRILGEGALSFSFIPVYVEASEADAQKLASALMSFLWVLASFICIVGIFFMDQLLPLAVGGGGYEKIAGKIELTVLFARIMFFYLFLVTNICLLYGDSQRSWGVLYPRLSSSLFNGAFIAMALWAGLSQRPVYLAWGVIVGGLLQVALVFWALGRRSRRPQWTWHWRVPGFFLVLRKMVPSVMGMGVLQLMSLVNIYFASHLDEGSHSYLYLGQRILELPQSLISISLSTALLPTLSRLWSAGRPKEMLATMDRHLRLLLFLAVPCAVLMYLFAEPIVVMLFLRGEFSPSDAEITSDLIKIFSLLLLVGSLNRVMVPALYAVKNTWYPALISSLCLLFHVVLAYFLINYGIEGLVLAMVISGFSI